MSTTLIQQRRGGLRTTFFQLHWWLIFLLAIISLVGVATLYSVAEGSWSPWAMKHAMRFGICLVILIGVGMTPLRFWMSIAYPVYFITLIMLMAVPIIGEVNMGAQRWLRLGPVELQPSEIMKVALVLALARYYHGLEFKRVSNPLYFAVPLIMIFAPVGLVFIQPDLGTSLLMMATGLSIVILAGMSWRVATIGAIFAAIGAVLAIQLGFLKQYQIDRLTAFMNPDIDVTGQGYQVAQSKIAIGSGGLAGKGYMEGTQSQLEYIPEKHTDFIYTIFSEEFGFVGAIGLLGLYLGVFLVGTNIAMRAKSHFGRLLAMGVCLTFIMYVLINTSMIMGLAPVVGVPLPLVSYGGTVMLTIMFGFGLVMSTWVCRDQDTLRTSSF